MWIWYWVKIVVVQLIYELLCVMPIATDIVLSSSEAKLAIPTEDKASLSTTISPRDLVVALLVRSTEKMPEGSAP